MKKNKAMAFKKISAFLVLGLSSLNVLAMDSTFTDLIDNVKKGCPVIWEDPVTPLPEISSIDPLTVFSTANGGQDKQEFETIYRTSNVVIDQATNVVTDPVTPAEMLDVFADAKAIAFECNAHRKNLFESMLSTNKADADAALLAAIGVANAIDFNSKQWRVGDVRVTGRAVPDHSWLFPTGQTIGAANSGAALSDAKYENLFEIAKTWGSNTGKTWGGAGDAGIVTLPDMRGRAIYGADNLGGTSKDIILDDGADKVGGEFGSQSSSIGTSNLPSHNHAVGAAGNHGHTSNNGGVHKHTNTGVGNHDHTIGNAPNHDHTSGFNGNHSHNLRTSVFTGSGAAQTWPYFQGMARPNYQNTITSSVLAAGNHNHPINAAGNHGHSASLKGTHNHTMANSVSHGHTINDAVSHTHASANVGGSAALKTVSPGITFSVEIKY
jgi:microcystin-dependent protein